MEDAQPRGLSRRAFGGALSAGVGAVAGGAIVRALIPTESSSPSPAATWNSDPHGPTQAGVARPVTPHPHALVSSFALPKTLADPAVVRTLVGDLATVGSTIASLIATKAGENPLIPDGGGDLAVTVGIGPRIARLVSSTGTGTSDLPAFAHDETIPPANVGGDLLIAVYSTSPAGLTAVSDLLAAQLSGASLQWRQAGSRGPGNGSIARNPLGFHDGVIVPRGAAELDENVWIRDGRYKGGTILVIRRLRLDVRRWNEQSTHVQEATIGRRKITGVPLSGGKPTGPVDLQAKTPEGEYLTPARSHVRSAHPSFTGSHLMLRRGYIFDNGTQDAEPDSGLLFMAYQSELRTFSDTQLRLDANDDLMKFATPTASATFLILPGFTKTRPLGSCLARN